MILRDASLIRKTCWDNLLFYLISSLSCLPWRIVIFYPWAAIIAMCNFLELLSEFHGKLRKIPYRFIFPLNIFGNTNYSTFRWKYIDFIPMGILVEVLLNIVNWFCRSLLEHTHIWTLLSYIFFIHTLLFWHSHFNTVSCLWHSLLW